MPPLTPSSLPSRVRAAILTLALCSLTACAGGGQPSPKLQTPEQLEPAPGYVGSARCGSCHANAFAAWESSRHHRALRVLGPGAPPLLAEKSLPPPWKVRADGGVEGLDASGRVFEARAAYEVGGTERVDLWVRLEDGRLQVFPFSVEVASGAVFQPLVRVSGGHEPPPDAFDFWLRLGRSADLTCYGCHATGHRLEASAGAAPWEPQSLASRWVEPGVGCEACHGAGRAHLRAVESGSADLAIAYGEDEASNQLCAGCHALRSLFASPFAPEPAQPYGKSLEAEGDVETRSARDFEFRTAMFDDLRPAAFQMEAFALSQSSCAQKGGLACARCHDPHRGELRPGADDGEVCVSCHMDGGGELPVHTRHRDLADRDVSCLDCHMAPVLRGPAGTPARDHSLAPPVAPVGSMAAACVVCHEEQPDGSVSAQSPAGRARLALIEAAAAAEAEPGGGASGFLGVIADASAPEGLRVAAARYLEVILARRTSPEASGVVGPLLAQPQSPGLARALLRLAGATRSVDLIPAVRRLAGVENFWVSLTASEALAALGAPDAEEHLRRLGRRSEASRTHRIWLALGRLYLARHDWEAAAEALERASRLHPFHIAGLNDLGAALVNLGRLREAEGAFRRALFLNPRFTPARRNLESVDALRTQAPVAPP